MPSLGPDAFESLMDAVEKARPKKVVIVSPTPSYMDPYVGVRTVGLRGLLAEREREPHHVTQVAGGAIAFKASAPNFL